jgi:hypothetical protein
MPKPLVFSFAGQDVAFTLEKVDRSKLYGFKEVEALDDQNRKCRLVTLADDGRTMVASGGVALSQLAADGTWCDKSSLTPVDIDGNRIEPVPSSYSAPVPLAEKTSTEHYLEHNVRSVYRIHTEDTAPELLEELTQGAIFKFPYSYRGGLEADAGFLLAGADGNLYLTIGNPTNAEFVGLQQAAAVVEEDTAAEDEGDLMDFDMI